MAKKKRKKKIQKPSPIPMHFEPYVPTNDFFEHLDLADPGDLDEALDNLIHNLKSDYFLLWEAVICEENGLPLTPKQRKALGELVDFSDEGDDDRILYINEIPRPREPWYEIARKIIAHLANEESFNPTFGASAALFEGWPRLIEALETYAIHLSLPEGAESPLDIIAPEILHRLNLQLCLDYLIGFAYDDEDQEDRIAWFIDKLKDHPDMVRYFDLTLEGLLEKVSMPAKDEKIVMAMMKQQLRLPSAKAPLIDFL